MNPFKPLVVWAGLITVIIFPAGAQQKISGLQSGIWKAMSGVYVANGDITVPKGLRLEIDEGTIVKFQGGGRFIVDGDLTVRGTEEKRVVFTSIADDLFGGDTNLDGIESGPTPLDWHGVFIRGTHAKILLRYADIRHALYPLVSKTADLQIDSLRYSGNSVNWFVVMSDTVQVTEDVFFSRIPKVKTGTEKSTTALPGPAVAGSPWYRRPVPIILTTAGGIGTALALYLLVPRTQETPTSEDGIPDPPGPP